MFNIKQLRDEVGRKYNILVGKSVFLTRLNFKILALRLPNIRPRGGCVEYK